MSGLRLYADKVSPVCRSVMLLLSANSIPYEYVYVSLKKGKKKTLQGVGVANPPFFFLAGETFTNKEFLVTNPNKRIPSIDDSGFTLFER